MRAREPPRGQALGPPSVSPEISTTLGLSLSLGSLPKGAGLEIGEVPLISLSKDTLQCNVVHVSV